MTKLKKYFPSLDEITFENRNKDYGAFQLRKRYKRTMIVSTFIGIVIISVAVIIPFIKAKKIAQVAMRDANEVIANMADNLQTEEAFTPPPPPPPPPAEQQVVAKYVAPEIVDSVKPEDNALKNFDDLKESTTDQNVLEIPTEAPPEEEVEEVPQEVFVVVEEMPSFPGGDTELLKFIYDNIQYPEIAKENNIQGKVIMRFCVTYKGTVDQVTVSRGVDPSLDEEAIRVIKMLPLFKPGKQGGKPVNVWYSLPISFQLK